MDHMRISGNIKPKRDFFYLLAVGSGVRGFPVFFNLMQMVYSKPSFLLHNSCCFLNKKKKIVCNFVLKSPIADIRDAGEFSP